MTWGRYCLDLQSVAACQSGHLCCCSQRSAADAAAAVVVGLTGVAAEGAGHA